MSVSEVIGFARDHSAKVVSGVFFILMFVFPALGSRLEPTKQITADYVSAIVNIWVPKEQQIGAADLPGGGVILTQESVADSANAELPSE